MLRSRLLLSCVLSLLLHHAVGITPCAGNPSVNLRGVIYSEQTNQRISHATVWLCDDGGNRQQESISDDSGEFAFMGLNAGAFILKVDAPGYDPAELGVEVSFSNERGISVFLKPSRKSGTKTASGSAISAHELSMPESARKLVDSGKKRLYADKNATGALREFEAAVEKAPDYYEAYFQMGMAYLSLQKAGEAETNLARAVELSQQSFAEADLALAILWIDRHDAVRGEPLLRRSLELNPNSWNAYFELGKLELYRNHLELAEQAGEKAKTLGPEQAIIYRLLSLVHLRQKDYAAALKDLEAYIRLDPDSPEGLTAKKIRSDTQELLVKSRSASVPASKPN